MYDKAAIRRIREAVEQWQETEVQKAQERLPERREQFVTASGRPVNRLYTAVDVADLDYEPRPRLTRALSVHPRRPGHRLPRQIVDDAHVCRLRHRRRDQRTLQVSAVAGTDGPLGRL